MHFTALENSDTLEKVGVSFEELKKRIMIRAHLLVSSHLKRLGMMLLPNGPADKLASILSKGSNLFDLVIILLEITMHRC